MGRPFRAWRACPAPLRSWWRFAAPPGGVASGPSIAQTARGSQSDERRIDLPRPIWQDRRARGSVTSTRRSSMRRLTVLVTTCGVLMGAFAGVASAHRPGDPPHQVYRMGDLPLENGQVIKDFAISYVTHGTLNTKKSNAILMVTALSGNHHRLDFLIGPGKALDTTKYFIVCTD